MSQLLVTVAGVIAGLIFFAATLIQFVKLIRSKSTDGLSIWTWFLFGVGNTGYYVYFGKYTDLVALVGQLGTALIDALIVGYALWLNSRKKE